MKYYEVKPNTKAEAWLREYSKKHLAITDQQHDLLKQLLGRRKKKGIMRGRSLVGCTYATGKLPDKVPHGLKLSKKPLDGVDYYIPDKRIKAGRDIATEFERLQTPSLSPICDILKFPNVSFSGLGMRLNDPGLMYRTNPDKFYICLHDELKPDPKQVKRISDLEWEKAKNS